MSVARVELEGSEPSGLAELLAGLLEQHLAREPERAAHLRPSVVVLEAPDADVAVTVRLSPGAVSVSDGVAAEAHLHVVAPADRLLALAGAPLRAGLPDPLHRDGRAVLADVVENHLDAIGHRTAVLVLGDARSNHTDPQLDLLREIAARARHVSWLNPEPSRMWGSGDSVALRYAEIVDMNECRNLAQLREFVARLLPV